MANKEEITLDFEFPFDIKKIWVTKKDNVILHCHDCLEINYVTSGKGLNIIENDIYELNANDLYLINNFQHHMAVSHEDLQMIIIIYLVFEKPMNELSAKEMIKFINKK